ELPRRPVRPLRRGAVGGAGDARRDGPDGQALAPLGLAPVRGLRRPDGPRGTLRPATAPRLAHEAALLNYRSGSGAAIAEAREHGSGEWDGLKRITRANPSDPSNPCSPALRPTRLTCPSPFF